MQDCTRVLCKSNIKALHVEGRQSFLWIGCGTREKEEPWLDWLICNSRASPRAYTELVGLSLSRWT